MMKALNAVIVFMIFNSYSQDTTRVITEDFYNMANRHLLVKGDSVSIIDSSGNIVMPYYKLIGNYLDVFGWDGPLYADSATPFNVVNKEGKMAVFTANGREMFGFKYDTVKTYARYFLRHQKPFYAFAVPDGEKWRLKDSNDLPLAEDKSYDVICDFWWQAPEIVVIEGDRAKFISLWDGKVYSELPERAMGDYLTLYSQTADAYGLVRRNGEIVFPFIYDYLAEYTIYDSLLVAEKDGMKGRVLHTGEILIPLVYEEVIELYDGEVSALKLQFPPYLGRKDGLFEILFYNSEKGMYEVVSQPLFKDAKTGYNGKLRMYKMTVTDEKGKSGLLIVDGEIKWEKLNISLPSTED